MKELRISGSEAGDVFSNGPLVILAHILVFKKIWYIGGFPGGLVAKESACNVGDLPNQGLNTHLLHWQVDLFPLSHQGSPKRRLKCGKFRGE